MGIVTEENDYPEPKPRSKRQRSISALDTSRSLVSLSKQDTDRSEQLTLQTDLQVQMVPVGASFQKFFKKRSEIDILDMEYHDKARFNQLSSVALEFPSKQISVTQSMPYELTPSRANLSRMGTTSGLQNNSKRHAMLSTREIYENRHSLRSTTPARGLKPERGQVRNFPFTSLSAEQNDFQDLEDMLADELSEKVPFI